MNRPKIEDYYIESSDAYSLKYVTDLEKYCDEQEDLSRKHIHLLEDNIIRLSKEFVKMSKALDKACQCLEEAYYEDFENLEYDVDMGMLIKTPVKANAEEWREWLLNDS